MPTLDNYASAQIIKLLLLGDSGVGKTGALASLVVAGYKLRILDFDNNLHALIHLIRRDSPDKLKNVSYLALRDKMKASDMGPILDGMPTAFVTGLKACDNWPEDSLGKPAGWGPDTIMVIDSLTMMADAAYNYCDAMNPGAKDKRNIYFDAQKRLVFFISLLTSAAFSCNVIVTAHVKYQERPDGTTKGFPMTVGKALGPEIPGYFNSTALIERTGVGANLTRKLIAAPTAMIDLRNPASFSMAPTFDIKTGLADFFKAVKV